MNVNSPIEHYKPLEDGAHPDRIVTLQKALRRATQLMHGEMEMVKKDNRNHRKMTAEDLCMNAESPTMMKKRRLQCLKRHALKSPPLSTDLRYRTVHPKAKDFELDVLNILDSHHKKTNHSEIYDELSKQEQMIKNQTKNATTKKYQLCQTSLGELLRKAGHSSKGYSSSSSSGGNSSPSRIVLSAP